MTTIDRAIADALTAGNQARPPADRLETVIVTVPKDSRLEALLCTEGKARDAHDAAEANWKELKSAIAAELQALYPGDAAPTKSFEIPGGPMWATMSVSWREGKEYLETGLIKEHIPQIWKAFKKQGRGYWELRRKGKR
jgi:hypothetical protein